MKREILINSKCIDTLNRLWEEHDVPVNMAVGRCENGVTMVTFNYEDKDETVVDWMIDRAISAL